MQVSSSDVGENWVGSLLSLLGCRKSTIAVLEPNKVPNTSNSPSSNFQAMEVVDLLLCTKVQFHHQKEQCLVPPNLKKLEKEYALVDQQHHWFPVETHLCHQSFCKIQSDCNLKTGGRSTASDRGDLLLDGSWLLDIQHCFQSRHVQKHIHKKKIINQQTSGCSIMNKNNLKFADILNNTTICLISFGQKCSLVFVYRWVKGNTSTYLIGSKASIWGQLKVLDLANQSGPLKKNHEMHLQPINMNCK